MIVIIPVLTLVKTAILHLTMPYYIWGLKYVISSLKSDKSPGIDGLVAEIFKCSFDFISPLLLKLFNIIFLNGMYPNSGSEGLITTIHKKTA